MNFSVIARPFDFVRMNHVSMAANILADLNFSEKCVGWNNLRNFGPPILKGKVSIHVYVCVWEEGGVAEGPPSRALRRREKEYGRRPHKIFMLLCLLCPTKSP